MLLFNDASSVFVDQFFVLSHPRVYVSQTNDLSQHPADITLDWVQCVGFLCDDDSAVSQPVITCVEGRMYANRTVGLRCLYITVKIVASVYEQWIVPSCVTDKNISQALGMRVNSDFP